MMRDMSSSAWNRRGSSVVFDPLPLGPLIEAGALVSMREALRWMNDWPAQPPVNSRTVLVCGIETFLEVMKPEEAEMFLKSRVKMFVQEFQDRWGQRGVVFGFGAREGSFELTASDEEVLFIRRDRERVRLSNSLWDGSATMNMTRLIRDEQGKNVTFGYHVARIS